MRIGLFGRGRFGSALLASARDAEDLEIAWAVDRGESPSSPVEVAIEASAADAVAGHLDWALATGSALVIGTTGWEIPDLDARVRGRIGVLAASNFSLAVALMGDQSVVDEVASVPGVDAAGPVGVHRLPLLPFAPGQSACGAR